MPNCGGTKAMKKAEYDYSAATKRIKAMRSKVIALKGGESVEGLSLPENQRSNQTPASKTAQKIQELN